MLGFGSGCLLPKQDGTIDSGDTLTLMWLYSGIVPSQLVTTGRLEFTFPRSLLEFTFPKTPDVTMDGLAEETLEQP